MFWRRIYSYLIYSSTLFVSARVYERGFGMPIMGGFGCPPLRSPFGFASTNAPKGIISKQKHSISSQNYEKFFLCLKFVTIFYELS